MLNNFNESSSEIDENSKAKFFQSVISGNTTEVISFFRNENYNVWQLKEHDDYTGKY